MSKALLDLYRPSLCLERVSVMPVVATDREVVPNKPDRPILTEFIRRISHHNTKIVRISLKGCVSDAEFSILSWLPSLRELRIEVSRWFTSHASLDSFYRGLRDLSPQDVPSLRVLFITVDWWADGYDEWIGARRVREQIDFDGRCAYIESAIDAVRAALHREDGMLTIHLREDLAIRKTLGFFEDHDCYRVVVQRLGRDYVSPGVYTSIVRMENLREIC